MSHKLYFLILAILGIGLPFNTPWHYSYALLIAFFIVFGKKRPILSLRWIALGIGILGSAYLVPQPNILEQQRLLVENNTIISPQNFINKPYAYPFSQTADGFVQRLGNTRLIHDINLTNNLMDLRSGYINKPKFNFYEVSIDRKALPFVVRYKITKDLLSHGVTGQGIFFYNNHFLTLSNPTAISFKQEMLGTYFYAFGADRRFNETKLNPYLSLKLNKTWKDHLNSIILTTLKLLGILILAYGFLVCSWKKLDWRELLLLAFWTVLLFFQHGEIIGREIFARAGSDGIVHGGYPYIMLEQLVAGNWLKTIESPESIFYYMPGMRYVRFIEMIIFGDSYPLQLIILLFTPVIYYRFFKVLLNSKYAFILASLMFIKALNFVGLSYKLHLVRFLKLYGENISYAFLIGGLTILIKGISSRWQGFWVFFLFAISASIRPNLIVFISILVIAYFFLPIFSKASKKDKFIHLLGLGPLVLIPLHNIMFGKKFILLTHASEIPENLSLPPHYYVKGFQCLLGLNSFCDIKEAFIKHFMGYGSLVVFFMISNLVLFLYQKEWNKIKVISIATFFALGMHLFYLADNRYLHPYFTISIVMFIFLIRPMNKFRK